LPAGQHARLQPPDWFAGHANHPELSAARADPQSSLDAGISGVLDKPWFDEWLLSLEASWRNSISF